ncbi:tetratricopeptide repeat protein [Flammeovirga pectinis]|uniref:Tetratricopeptide repeat protein n=1 Tax=Flammeovirga pectinis TaxID=2494373 RepID=A0A3Q9FTJ1_9BACT|nr:tetratricopeptide repeat protein [Flammeovirga pectinis]AZQ64113.1 tetratricopeptide repeat protein [Flammeovirga pectinis]
MRVITIHRSVLVGIGVYILMLLPFFASAQTEEKDSIKIQEHSISDIQVELDSLISNKYHIEATALADSLIDIANQNYSNTDERIVLLHKRIAEKFADNGYSNIASQYIQRGLAVLRSNPTPNYAFIGDMYIYLAQIFRHHQLSNIAINYYEQALEAYEQAEGKAHYFSLVNVYMTLGTFHYEIENYGTSSSYYTKASDVIAKMDTEYRADMVEILNRIATAQAKTGSFKVAIVNLERSVKIALKVFGKNSLQLADQYESLASVYLQKEDYAKVDENATAFVRILVGNIGTNQRRQTYERRIADSFFGRYQYHLSHKWYNKLFDDVIISTKDVEELQNLTDWYIQVGEKFERVKQDSIAFLVFESSLKLNQKQFGENNLEAAKIYHLLSRSKTKLEHFVEAETYTNKAYQIEWELGTEKDSTQIAVQNIDLAGLLLMKGDTLEASILYHNVIDLEKDRESRWKAIAFNNLTMIKYGNQEYDSAYFYGNSLLEYYQTNYGRDYIKTLGCYLLLGNIVFDTGDTEAAVEKFYSKPIRLAPKLFLKNNEVSYKANINLSNYYLAVNKEDLSRRYERNAQEIQVIIFSEEKNIP